MPKPVNAQKKKETVELFKDAKVNKDGQQELKDGKFIMTQKQVEGDDWVDVDVAMPDAVKIREKLEDEKKELKLKGIHDKLKEIEKALDVPLPEFSEVKGGGEHKAEVNQQNLLLIEKYNELVESCDAALEDRELDAEDVEQVKNIKKDVEKERDELPEAILRFTQIISKSGEKSEKSKKIEEKEKRKRTYGDALRFQRGEFYDLDLPDAKFSVGGAGTSKLFVIERGDKKLYFKKEENSFDDDKSIAEYASKIAKNYPGLDQDFVDELTRQMDADFRANRELFYHFVPVIFFELKDTHKVISDKSRLDMKTAINETESMIIRRFNAASKEGKELIKDFIIDFGAQYNSSVVSKENAMIKPGNNISRRNVATSRMATLLGIDDLVASSRNATILHDNKVIQGNIMDEAKDVDLKKLKNKKYSDNAVDQLHSLQLFDLICGQIDRKFGNYTQTLNKNGEIDNIVAIDNDLSFGEISYDELIEWENPKGITVENYVLMPKKLKEAVLRLSEEKIRMQFMDLITAAEINALLERIRLVRRRLRLAEQKIRELDEDERFILNDPDLGKKWMLYTMAVKKTDALGNPIGHITYMEAPLMKSPSVLKKELISALKKRKLEYIPQDRFKYLAPLE